MNVVLSSTLHSPFEVYKNMELMAVKPPLKLHRIRAGFYWRHGGGDRRQACCLILAHVVSVADNFEGTVWVDGRPGGS